MQGRLKKKWAKAEWPLLGPVTRLRRVYKKRKKKYKGR